MATKYSYTIPTDITSVRLSNLINEIQNSAIVTALDLAQTIINGATLDIWFAAALSSGDKTILDNDATAPAGGLLAAHDPTSPADDPAPMLRDDGVLYATPKPSSFGMEMCDRDFKITSCKFDALATLTINGADANGHVKYDSPRSGAGGNDVTVAHVDTSGGLVVTVTGLAVSVDFGGAAPTATQVADAVNAAAAHLVTATEQGTGASAASTQAATALAGGTTNSLEDLKIETTTNKEAPWDELTLTGVYKDSSGMVLCTNQADADTNGILTVWDYQARLPATRALIKYEVRDGMLFVDPLLPYSARFDHKSYAIVAPTIPGYLGGSIAVFDGYLGGNPLAKLEASPDKWSWSPIVALSPQATILDPAGAGGPAGACIRIYIYHPAGIKLEHVLRLVMYRAVATF